MNPNSKLNVTGEQHIREDGVGDRSFNDLDKLMGESIVGTNGENRLEGVVGLEEIIATVCTLWCWWVGAEQLHRKIHLVKLNSRVERCIFGTQKGHTVYCTSCSGSPIDVHFTV